MHKGYPGWPDEQAILIPVDCPNGHRSEWNLSMRYAHAGLRELLDAGTLMFWCHQCHTEFPLTKEGILSLRKQLAGGPPPPGLHWRG